MNWTGKSTPSAHGSSLALMAGWLVLAVSTTAPLAVHAEPASANAEAPANDSHSTGTLSVAPTTELRYPQDRPQWIDAGPSLTGKVHRWPVSSPPSSTAELSRSALQVQLRAATETYIETLLESAAAPSVIELTDEWIAEHVNLDRCYEGTIDAGGEELYEAAAELRFERRDRDWLETQWVSSQVRQRLLTLGAITAGGTLMLVMTTACLSLVARRQQRS